MLPNIIHHRNLLKNYRSNIDIVIESIDHRVQLWLDFSENLTVPVKQEPQSLHWSKEQKTVHSGILKMNGEKQYHPYMSDDLKHDQCFVSNVVGNMVAEVNISAEMTLLIVSDNCPGQYKSVQNFFDMQNLCNKHGVRIVRVYGIPGHGVRIVRVYGIPGHGVRIVYGIPGHGVRIVRVYGIPGHGVRIVRVYGIPGHGVRIVYGIPGHGVRIVYGIPGHGKKEIDCVGGVVKIALRRAVTVGEFFPSAACCIDYLHHQRNLH